jgi:hypothetical protein
MARAPRLDRTILLMIAGALLTPGCRLAPREQLEDCHRLSQTLRSENAQLKDRMLALQSQNRDLSERAVDDSRRLAQFEEVNTRLETSVQAYQDERSRLESAYKDLRASLPNSPQPLTLRIRDDDKGMDLGKPDAEPERDPGPEHDADLRKTDGPGAVEPSARRSRSDDDAQGRGRGSWSPSRSGESHEESPAFTNP